MLLEQGRIDSFGEADYREGTQTAMWITQATERIAQRIVGDREIALSERVGLPPRHVADD